jgi:hypothetical protein
MAKQERDRRKMAGRRSWIPREVGPRQLGSRKGILRRPVLVLRDVLMLCVMW